MINRKRKEFLGLPAPMGYVAGMGRGATGFTTRSDIGPARDDTDVPDERHSQFKKKDDDDNENLNDSNYDEFSGYGGSLCAKDPYDEDDQEADLIYEQIEKHLDGRRKPYREEREIREIEKYRKKRPKIQQQFADLKRQLADVTYDQWKNLPDVGDARNKKQRNPRHELQLPTPDSLIQKSFADSQTGPIDGSITPGIRTPSGSLDMRSIGKARTQLMDNRLNQVSDNITGQTVIDSKGYLTDLQSMTPQIAGSFADVSDVKRTRKMFQSMVESEPTRGEAWLAYGKFEEHFHKINEAKQIILNGCSKCPEMEDLWLYAVYLMGTYSGKDNQKNAKAMVQKALRNKPDSVNLWVKAADLEDNIKLKKKVFEEALKEIPVSVKLWKCAVELEEPDTAKVLLEGAVECCPNSVELWLALARLCEPVEARKVLNKARQKNPTERQIWITAFKLEESSGNSDKLPILVSRAMEMLEKNKMAIRHDEWLADAQSAEKANCPATACAIVKLIEAAVVGEERDKKHTWLADAEFCEESDCIECARSVFSVACAALPHKKSIWKRAALLEKRHGDRDNYEEVLRKAVKAVPKAEVLWLMLAKSRWEAGATDDARMELNSAFTANPNSEDIMLAAVKLESESEQFARARRLLQKALDSVDTPRVWMKAARLEWCLGELGGAQDLLERAVARFPSSGKSSNVSVPVTAKLWMMLGQVKEARGLNDEALEALKQGAKHHPDCQDLCILRANLESRMNKLGMARTTLERAVANCNNGVGSPELWLARIRLESKCGDNRQASYLLSQALQRLPTSDILWAESIELSLRRERTKVAQDAVSKCENSERVLLAVAKMLWAIGNTSKAREWLERSVKVEKLYGDAWAYLYRLECVAGTEDNRVSVRERCVAAEPRYGEYWVPVSKAVVNWKMKTEEVLITVAAQLPLPT